MEALHYSTFKAVTPAKYTGNSVRFLLGSATLVTEFWYNPKSASTDGTN